MLIQYVVLFLLPLAIRCQNGSNWDKLQLNDTVIPLYQNVVTLFNNNIVGRLMNADLMRINRSSSPLTHELYCTVQEIHLNLKQASLDNDNYIRQTDVRIDQLLDSIARLENETIQPEPAMDELNKTVENAREQVRLAKIVAEQKQKLFSDLIGSDSKRSWDSCNTTRSVSNWHTDGNGVQRWRRPYPGSSFHEMSSLQLLCFRAVLLRIRSHTYRNSPSNPAIRDALDEATTNLTKQENQLKEEIEKYRSAQSLIMDNAKQLVELNMTLGLQQAARAVATTLNTHFKTMEHRLKMVSDPSKRLLDVLKNLLDLKAISEPLKFIYEKLFIEQMIESSPLVSYQTIDKSNHKLTLLAAKLPELRNRQKQFHQPCAYSVPKPAKPLIDMKLSGTTWVVSSNETDGFRFDVPFHNQFQNNSWIA